MANKCLSLVLHGGAGTWPDRDYTRELVHMRGVVEAARDRLLAGIAALDVVTEAVAALEASGLYVAGRGASPNTSGRFELDASLMHGPSRRAGAIAALEGFAAPIRVARAVMDESPHVLLAGEGAAAFAGAHGLARVTPDWFTPVRGVATPPSLTTGTVGCVALDETGALAAATSTGGVPNKVLGRVGDSPIVGAGVWADERVGVSCTGAGEFFIRAAAAAQISFRMGFGGETLADAAAAALADVASLGGSGGLIALSAGGQIAMPFNSPGMKRATLQPDGTITAEVF